MLTAVDSSVLIAIFNEDRDGRRWLDKLIAARREGRLVCCDVVFAELAAGFNSENELWDGLNRLGVAFDPVLPGASFVAGEIFGRYRAEGGPRRYMIPDFLVAAHAMVQADRVAAVDRGYLRRYFAGLALL